jgi:hypothetical protein
MTWAAFIIGLVMGIVVGLHRRRRAMADLRAQTNELRSCVDLLDESNRRWFGLAMKNNGPSYPNGRPAAGIDGSTDSDDAYHPRAP